MPAKSKAQQRAAALALSAKRGQTETNRLQGAAKEMHESMTEGELEDFANTDLQGLPEHVPENQR